MSLIVVQSVPYGDDGEETKIADRSESNETYMYGWVYSEVLGGGRSGSWMFPTYRGHLSGSSWTLRERGARVGMGAIDRSFKYAGQCEGRALLIGVALGPFKKYTSKRGTSVFKIG